MQKVLIKTGPLGIHFLKRDPNQTGNLHYGHFGYRYFEQLPDGFRAFSRLERLRHQTGSVGLRFWGLQFLDGTLGVELLRTSWDYIVSRPLGGSPKLIDRRKTPFYYPVTRIIVRLIVIVGIIMIRIIAIVMIMSVIFSNINTMLDC